jgi:hypothetical protein
MSHNFSKGKTEQDDIIAKPDQNDDTKIDFEEDEIALHTSGSCRLKISGPQGQITINESYTLPAVDGQPGQVLQTDGAGNLSWVDVDPVSGSEAPPPPAESYEYGTWSPQGNGFSFTTAEGSYQKVGNMVAVTFKVRFPETFTGDVGSYESRIQNLPYISQAGIKGWGEIGHLSNGQGDVRVFVAVNSTNIKLVNNSAQVKQNANFADALLHGGAIYFTN